MWEPQVHRLVQELFDTALEMAPEARTAFLDEACAGDTELRQEVEALIAAFEGTDTAELLPPLLRADLGTLAVGECVGPYTLRREVGTGGMGVVYEATREDVGKTVALKLVRHGRLASPDHLRRFQLEQRVLARLEHPNIARLLDAGVTKSGLPYLAMEFVEGEAIDAYCDARRLTIEERLALFGEVCDAVHYAHRHLVVHRDLKPSNIAVSPATEARSPGSVKLLDFGIALLLGEEEDGSRRITGTGLVVLTPDYAAPEQVRGDPVTVASDVYALGVLLFELLTGRRPFHRSALPAAEMLLHVKDEEAEAPSRAVRRTTTIRLADGTTGSLTPESVGAARQTHPARLSRRLAGDLDTIVLRALRAEPERRYHSVQEFWQDIERHLAGRPVEARGDAFWYRARKFVRRHRSPVVAGATLTLSLVAGVFVASADARRADAARAVEEQRFRDMRSLAGALVSDVHDAIRDLPGTLPVRARLVTRALDHLQRLERQSGDDPALKRDIAEGYLRLASTQGNPTGANLGDLSAARTNIVRAMTLASSLVTADTNDRAARRTLALAHEAMSDADAWIGDLTRGVEHARHALGHWQRLAAASPASAGARFAVAMSHVKLGDLLGNPNLPNLSKGQAASREYRDALGLMEALPADSLKGWRTRRLLALVHERLGAMLHHDGREAEAIAQYEEALGIRDALLRERSTSVDARRDLAVAHQLLCETLLAAGDRDGALERCTQALALYASLRAADSQNVQGLRDLSLGHQSMHKVLAAGGAQAAALAQLDLSIAASRRLLQSPNDNVPIRRDLARALLFATVIHARATSDASTAQAVRTVHRARAATAYAEAQQLMAETRERGSLPPSDSLLLQRARRAIDRMRGSS